MDKHPYDVKEQPKPFELVTNPIEAPFSKGIMIHELGKL